MNNDTQPIRYGSVCSGIESASIAWEVLGWQPAWFAEIEPFPSAVLAHHWPHVTNLGDMTKIAARILAGEIEAPDVLVGGTPCQAFSVAGARKGLADDRGQLTISFGELADAIDTRRAEQGKPPCVIVWENVPGVLSDKTNAFGAFLGLLAGEDCSLQPPGKRWETAGFVLRGKRAIAWRVLDAQYFGVAQRRRRVFVVASSRADFDPTAVLFERDGVRRDIAPSREAGKAVAALTANGVGTCGADDNQGQAGHLVPVEGFRMVAFGEYSDDGTASTMKARDYKDATDLAVCVTGDICHTLSAEAGQTGEGDAAPCVVTAFSAKDYGADATEDLSPTLRAGNHNQSHANSGSWMAVAFAENSRSEIRLQDGDGNIAGPLSTGGGKPGQGYPAVAITQYGEELAGTLTARHDSSPCHDRGQNMLAQSSMAVRRLTPVECELLQGFPPNHTLIPEPKRKKLEDDMKAYYRHHCHELTDEHLTYLCSDGPRYKAIGNSKAVPVVRWIGRRLDKALRAAK